MTCEWLKEIDGKWYCNNKEPVECFFNELMNCKATTLIKADSHQEE